MFLIKKFIIAIIILASVCSVTAQEESLKNSSEIYNYWTQRGITEMIYAYMEDYVETVKDSSELKNELKGKNEYYTTFIEHIDNKGLEAISSDSNELSTFLKDNNWVAADKNLLSPLIKNYRNKNEFNENFFVIYKPNIENEKLSTVIPGYDNKSVNWDKSQSSLIKSYNLALSELQNKKEIPIDDSNKPKVQDTDKNSSIIKSIQLHILNDYMYYFSAFIGFLIGGIFMFWYSKDSIYEILQMEKENYLNQHKSDNKRFFNYINLVDILKQRKDYYKNTTQNINNTPNQNQFNRIKEKDNRIKELLSKIQVLENKIPQYENDRYKNPETTDHKLEKRWDIKKQEENINIIKYFSIPKNDGSFTVEQGSSSNEGRKFYKIEYEPNSNIGNLSYISSEFDKRAINRKDTSLEPVCDIENIENSISATQIKLISKGNVKLVGDRWLIDPSNKVKIKLI